MGIDVYCGFQVEEKVLENQPRDIVEAARFFSVLLDQHITAEDIAVYGHIRNQFTGEESMANQDLGSAWHRVLVAHPLNRVMGSLCGLTYLEREHGIALEVEDGIGGSTTDKVLMWRILNALELNTEAIYLIDCMYWG